METRGRYRFYSDLITIVKGGRAGGIWWARELPQLARLPVEDQIFIAAFMRSHGSIKEMENVFGVSYPTVKARLNRIAGALQFIDTNPLPSRSEVLERLAKGKISAEQAIKELEGKS